MAAERWCRMSSASTANVDRWATEVAWINSRGFVGVRVNIALADADSSGLAYNAASPNYSNPETVLDLIIGAGLKCQLGIGGDGPPVNSSWYSGVGGYGSAWPYPKRPPAGATGIPVIEKTAEIKSACIALMFDKYRDAGYNPFDYCFVELGNEPARGGAGAPDEMSGFWPGSYTTFKIGTWDSPGTYDPPGASTPYMTFCEYFNLEMPLIDFKGLRLIAPTFACIPDGQDLNGLTQELATCLSNSTDWLPIFKATFKPMWGVNLYYSLYEAEVALGASLYAHRAVYGRDLRVERTEDANSAVYRLQQIRDWIDPDAVEAIRICETGVQPNFLRMSTDMDNRLRKLNYFELGRARLELLDLLVEQDVDGVILFTATDDEPSSDPDKQFGVFNDDLGTVAAEQTYSAEIPFGMRVGESVLEPFAGTDYQLAAAEVLPPKLS